MRALFDASESDGYWTLQAQIMAGNEASLALHRKCGFRQVGVRERYGHIGADWHDVILLERRSDSTGGPDLPTKQCD